jgi:ankyrin repeat protein
MVEWLLVKGSDVEERDARGRSPLSWAVERGHTRVTMILLEYGAKSDTEWLRYDQYQQSMLYNTAAKGHASVILLPPATHANTGPGHYRGWTLIHGAAYHGMHDAVQILLDRGASIESRDIFGQTPLILAADNGHPVTVGLLILRGADLKARDNDGKTAYSCAALNYHEEVLVLLKDAVANTESGDQGDEELLSISSLEWLGMSMGK